MPKLFKYLLTFIILSLFLAACGTSNEKAEPVNEDEQPQQEETQEEKGEETEPNTDNENNNSEQENEDVMQKPSTPSEIPLKYSFNGKLLEEKAIWKKSDNQAFGLYVLPGYELTAEEPRNDLLYYKENELHSMRIQLLPGDSDIEPLKENTIAQLKASLNTDVETLSPPSDFPKDTTVMQTKNEEDLVTAYLIKDQAQDQIIKLMIFTKNQENHLDTFIQMAKHIKVD